MKPKTITYSESVESVNSIGLKRWTKIGVEGEIEENENFVDASNSAKNLVQQALHGNRQPPEQSSSNVSTSLPEINREAERLEILIENAVTEDELMNYKNDAVKYGLWIPFELKLAQLQKK